MIRTALQYMVGLGQANVKEYTLPDGDKRLYSDKPLHEVTKHIPIASPLKLHTLTSLVDYIKSYTDTMADKMIIEIESPTRVCLYSALNDNRDRECLVEVNAMIPEFSFGRFMDHEVFCIGIQSKFMDIGDREAVLRFAGTVESGTVAQYGDDGVTQKATIRTGLASKGEALLPNPVELVPYRTFLEVDQPESYFIFRMREGVGVECGIFEADGGAWQIRAVQSVKEYFKKELGDMNGFAVIA